MPAPASRAARRRSLRLRGALAGAAAAVVLAGVLPSAAQAATSQPTTSAAAPAGGTSVLAAAATSVGAVSWWQADGEDRAISIQLTPVDGVSPMTGYQVSLDAGGTWAPLKMVTPVSTDQLTGRVEGLTTGQTYRVALRALSATGPGPATSSQAIVPSPRDVQVSRVGGADRIATAIAISTTTYPTAHTAPAVVLSTSATYADALAGAAFAGQQRAPLLLVSPGGLDATVDAEVRRVLQPAGRVYVLGDTGAVSREVETRLSGAFPVTRLQGATRFETAQAVAQAAGSLSPARGKGPLYLVSGTNFPDGLAVAALAARTDGTVLLTDGASMPASTASWIASFHATGTDVVPVGGPAATAAATLPRATAAAAARNVISGADRYETAALVAREIRTADYAPQVVGIATGTNWPDALAGAADDGVRGGALLLVDGSQPDWRVLRGQADGPALGVVSTWFSDGPLREVIYGDEGVISSVLANRIGGGVIPQA